MQARLDDQETARRMRAAGASIVAIARDLDAARSSVSVWVRHVDLPPVLTAEPPTGPIGDIVTGERRCSRCELVLPLAAFGRNGRDRQYWCRKCYRAYVASRRELHGRQVSVATARRRDVARRIVLDHLLRNPCVDCGAHDLVVLEFDHVRGTKKHGLADMTHHGASPSALAAELANCDVVCVSCHRYRTATRALSHRVVGEACASWAQKTPSQRRAMTYVAGVLGLRRCVDCREERPACLDFDHRGDKTATVANLVHDGASNTRLDTEIAKCEVRCASCHRRRTEVQRRSWKTQI